MDAAADSPRVALAEVLGLSPADLRERFGDPVTDRELDGQRWLVFDLEDLGSLRCRCSPVLGTWTLSFAAPLPGSLRSAARSVGLWPELGPDVELPATGEELVRREMSLPGEGGAEDGAASATALLSPEGVRRLAAFDEAPEW